MSKAEQLIACLEGEITKRDAELAACRVAVENCEVFRARIAELEARIVWLECEAQVNAAPVSEAKAQGVVQWPNADEIMQMAFEEGQPADDASGYYFELEEFDLFIERLMSEVARLNAAPVQQPKCKTCDDNGRIGGPSFYAPDEGGEPCPDCSAHAQQVSVPDGWKLVPVEPTHEMLGAALMNQVECLDAIAVIRADYKAMIAAATAAPAADAGLSLAEWAKDANEWGGALNYAAWEFVNECPEKSALLFNNTKGPLRAAIMKYAEIVAAHRTQGAV